MKQHLYQASERGSGYLKKHLRLIQYAVLLILAPFSQLLGQATQQEVLDNTAIITMKKMNFSVDIIKNKISTTSCDFKTDIQSLSELKTAGVDDAVIEVMITKMGKSVVANSPKSMGVAKLSEDGKTYVTTDGITFHVGDPIKINIGSNSQGLFKYITRDQGKVFNLINNVVPLDLTYARQTFTIEKIYTDKSSSNELFIKNATRTVYITFLTSSARYRIAIEAALQEKEVLPN